MRAESALPLFDPHAGPPRDPAFDFLNIETIAARAALHDWTILVHRHSDLSQILVIGRGGGEMLHETAIKPFEAPAVILVAPGVAHGFRFRPRETDGWILSFSRRVARTCGGPAGAALAGFTALASDPILPLGEATQLGPLCALCADLDREHALAREGHRIAERGFVALIVVEMARLGSSRERSGTVSLAPADATLAALRALIEQHFRRERHVSFYAEHLATTPHRLKQHLKRAASITAGHLIRQRLLAEAKRQIVFTNAAIHEIGAELGFADPSHFIRFFRKNTGTTPQAFRESRGG